jgi:hypothetical protein
MNVLRTFLVTGLLTGVAVAAHSGPHWTASIGTGHATASTSAATKPIATKPLARQATRPCPR